MMGAVSDDDDDIGRSSEVGDERVEEEIVFPADVGGRRR